METKRDKRDDQGHPPRDEGTEEEGPPCTQEPGSRRPQRGSGLLLRLSQGTGLFCCGASGKRPEDGARTGLKCSIMLGEGNVAPDFSDGH